MKKHSMIGLTALLLFTVVLGHQVSNSFHPIEQTNQIVLVSKETSPSLNEGLNYKLDLNKETLDQEESSDEKKMDKKTLFTILLIIPVVGILIGLILQLTKLKKAKK